MGFQTWTDPILSFVGAAGGMAYIDLPPIVVPTTVLVQRPPEAWGEGR